MSGRVFAWMGAGFLTGALALASAGAVAPQAAAPAAEPAPQACISTPDRLDRECVDPADLPHSLAAARLMAPRIAARRLALAAAAISRVGQELRAAWPVLQDAPDGESIQIITSDSGHSWLGIRMEEVTGQKAKELKLPADRGVLVSSVSEDSPAAKAGLKAGDVILEFDGQRVEGTAALARMVREVPPGRSVSLSVWREGRALSLNVEIGSRGARRSLDRDFYFEIPELPDVAIPPIPPIPAIPSIEIGPMTTFRMFGAPLLGIDAEDLSGQLGNYFGAPGGQGILVREVMPGSAAEKAGLKAGDVILRVDGKRVKDMAELRSALRDRVSQAGDGSDSGKSAPVASVASELTLLRAGKEITVRVELQPPIRRIRPMHHVAV